MIIIGELINASRKAIKAAIEAKDAAAIGKVARDQAEAGADYIDVNAGIFVGKEPAYLQVAGGDGAAGHRQALRHRQPGPGGHRGGVGRPSGYAHDQLDQPGEGAL